MIQGSARDKVWVSVQNLGQSVFPGVLVCGPWRSAAHTPSSGAGAQVGVGVGLSWAGPMGLKTEVDAAGRWLWSGPYTLSPEPTGPLTTGCRKLLRPVATSKPWGLSQPEGG